VIVAAALVPHPPLLLRELGGGTDPVADLRAAAGQVVRELVREAEEVVVVGPADTSATWDPATPVDARRFGGAGERVGRGLPLSLGVGRRLLDEVGWDGPVELRSVAWDAADVEAVAAEVVDRPTRTALLVLGDGSARRGEQAPGYVDDRAFGFDDVLAKALADGEAEALRGLDSDLAADLMVLGRSSFRLLGTVALAQGGRVHATLCYRDDPFGVTYLVALWTFTTPAG
jgi:hypothetical protein